MVDLGEGKAPSVVFNCLFATWRTQYLLVTSQRYRVGSHLGNDCFFQAKFARNVTRRFCLLGILFPVKNHVGFIFIFLFAGEQDSVCFALKIDSKKQAKCLIFHLLLSSLLALKKAHLSRFSTGLRNSTHLLHGLVIRTLCCVQ